MADKDYLAIAKQRVRRPQDVEGYRKIFIYARNKKGKTRLSLSAGIDNTIVLDPENGTDSMKTLNPYVWPIEKWADMQEAWGALRTGKLSPNHLKQGESSTPFTWASVDGLTRMNNMALKYVMSVQEERDLDRPAGFVQQRDYGKSSELMKQMLLNFQALKMNVCYTAQEKMMTIDTPYDDDADAAETEAYYVPDLPNAVRGAVNSLAEAIGRLYTVEIPAKDGVTMKVQRRLQIGLHERYDTGFRSDFALPEMIKQPTLPKLVALMIQGGS